jgi:hypothetical protein
MQAVVRAAQRVSAAGYRDHPEQVRLNPAASRSRHSASERERRG